MSRIGFADAWLPEAEVICRGFGERPPGVACPLAIFARPIDRRHVAVVRAADQQGDALAFHLLVLTRRFYLDLGGDLFLVCEKVPATFSTSGEMPTVEWTAGPPPSRTRARPSSALALS